MDFTKYQNDAAAYMIPDLSEAQAALHAFCGLSAETGECCSIIQKNLAGHSIDPSCLREELGDVLYFISEITNIWGLSLDDIAQNNLNKLKIRFPKGKFSTEDSISRVDHNDTSFLKPGTNPIDKDEETEKILSYNVEPHCWNCKYSDGSSDRDPCKSCVRYNPFFVSDNWEYVYKK